MAQSLVCFSQDACCSEGITTTYNVLLQTPLKMLLCTAGMIAVALTPNMKIAAVCSSYMYSLFHLFAGFVITQVNMPGWW